MGLSRFRFLPGGHVYGTVGLAYRKAEGTNGSGKGVPTGATVAGARGSSAGQD